MTHKEKLQKEDITQVIDLRRSVPAGLWFTTSKDASGSPKYTYVHFNHPRLYIAFGIEDMVLITFMDGNADSSTRGRVFQEKILVLDIRPDIEHAGWMTVHGLQKESKEIVKEN